MKVLSPTSVAPLASDSPIGHRDVSGVVYISARPRMLKAGTYDNVTSLVGVQPQAILCGTLMTSFTNAAMARMKVANYAVYHTLFPEFRIVWLGDSGQGDILVGHAMLEMHARWVDEQQRHHQHNPGSPKVVVLPPRPLVLIHDLRHSNQQPYNDAAARADLSGKGIFLFDSYVDAAAIAYQHGMLSASGLDYVVGSAADDLTRQTFVSTAQEMARRREFHEATARAQALVKAAAAAVSPGSGVTSSDGSAAGGTSA